MWSVNWAQNSDGCILTCNKFYLLFDPGKMSLPACLILGRVDLRINPRVVLYSCLFVTCLINSERELPARTLRIQSRHFSERDGSITNRNKAIAVRWLLILRHASLVPSEPRRYS